MNIMASQSPCLLLLVAALATSPLLTAGQGTGCATTSWAQLNNTNVLGGILQSATTLQACQDACVANSNCIAIDFNTFSSASPTCYFILSGNTGAKNIGGATGVTHYDLTRSSASCAPASSTPLPSGCVSTPSWAQLNNTNVLGGIQQSATTLQACQDACVANSSCIAIDFNTFSSASPMCYFILSGNTGTKNIGGATGVTHYDLTRGPLTCSSGTACTPTWIQFNNTNVAGGIQQASTVNTLAFCQAACIAATTCIGIDFNTYDNSCWFTGTGARNNGSAAGINHFDLVPCPLVSGQPLGSTTPSCINTWTLSANTNYGGGIGSSTANTLKDCQDACIASSTCVAVDYNSNATPKCYLLTNLNGTKFSGGNSGIDHWDLNRCGSSASGATYQIWYHKTGGVVSIDQNTKQIVFVDDINKATWFISSSCLAATNPGFNNSGNCVSWSTVDTPGFYSRNLWGTLVLEQQSGQYFPLRFNEDASFYTYLNAFNAGGYTSIQPVVNVNNTYYVVRDSNNLVLKPQGISASDAYATSASFFAVSVPLPTGTPVTGTCPNTWTRISGAFASNTVPVGYISLADCRRRCLVYPSCTGVSYSKSQYCYIETTDSVAAPLTADPTFDHFDLWKNFYATCTRGCTYTWQQTTGYLTNYYIGTSSNDFFSCRVACVNNVNCLGIYWSSNGTFTNCSLIFPYGSNNGWNNTITYYSLIRSFVNCGPCSVNVHIIVGLTDSNGVLQAGVTSRSSCRTACVNNRVCTGYDIINGTICKLSLTSNVSWSSSPSSSHTDILRSPCGNGCQDKWDLYPATTGVSTTQVAGITTEQACRFACQQDTSCNSCDWNFVNKTCWSNKQSNSRNLEGTSPGVNHYEFYQLYICDEDS